MIERSLPSAASLALEVLYQHRLLSTSQLREVLGPELRKRSVQAITAELVARRMISGVASKRPAGPGKGDRLWFLTRLGAELVEAVPHRTETRRRLLTPELAQGPHQAHTLAVNDAGIAFLRAARERDHDFGPFSWQHEVAHELGGTGSRPELLVADALLRYWTSTARRQPLLRYRLLELDRANLQVDDLAGRVIRYVRLYRHWLAVHTDGAEEGSLRWPAGYRVFPALIVALANPARANLERRMRTVMALSQSSRDLQECEGFSVSFVVFEELREHGPFAPVFHRLDDDRLVNWLGDPESQAQPGRAA